MDPNSAKGKKELQEAYDKLNGILIDMEKAGKQIAVVVAKGDAQDKKTCGLKERLTDAKAAAKDLEIEKNNLAYIVKFRETPEKEPLTVKMAIALSHKCAAQSNKALEATKTLKALLPSKPSSE